MTPDTNIDNLSPAQEARPPESGAGSGLTQHEQDLALLANLIREASINEELPTAAALRERLMEQINAPKAPAEADKTREEKERLLQDFAQGENMLEAYNASAKDADTLILQQRLLGRRELFQAVFSMRREENYGGTIVRAAWETPSSSVATAPRADITDACQPDTSAGQMDDTGTNTLKENPSSTAPIPDRDVPPLRHINVEEFEALLADTLSANPDLALLHGLDGGVYYHSPALLSVTYAEIVTGKTVPMNMVAETVRKNSREYPRPLALEIFEYPPFDLTPEALQNCLHAMSEHQDYTDICYVESCVGTVYLYSSRYMDEDYASFLADKEDVGMVESP